MTCREAIGALGDYLEAILTPPAAARLEAHLRDCEECRAYLATYERTRGLTARLGRVEMPEALRERLRRFLLERLGPDR